MDTGPERGFGARLLSVPVIAVAAVVLAVGFAVILGRSDPAEAFAEPAPIPVQVREVRAVERPEYLALSGDVVPRQIVRVGFRVAGMVEVVNAEEGQRVAAGDVLAEMDGEDYRLQLEAATAAVARVEDQYERARQMQAGGQIAPADFIAAESGVAEGRARLALAQRQYDNVRLTAPVGGIVAYRGVQPGEQVPIGTPVFAIVSVNPIEVRVGVPEREIGRVRPGLEATVSISSLSGWVGEGRVRLVGVVPDSISRTYPVRISLPNPDGVLKPGMIADVRIIEETRISAITLPGEAIVRRVDGSIVVYVYSPSEQRVRSRTVTVGSVFDQEVEITQGLAAGDLVVVGGQHRVRDGSPVEAVAPSPRDNPVPASTEGRP